MKNEEGEDLVEVTREHFNRMAHEGLSSLTEALVAVRPIDAYEIGCFLQLHKKLTKNQIMLLAAAAVDLLIERKGSEVVREIPGRN